MMPSSAQEFGGQRLAASGAIDIADLRKSFDGNVVEPADAGYDDARAVWNGSIDRRPAVIAGCTSAADVAAAIRFARANDLTIAVRGGGHSYPGFGTCDDGLVIDFGAMRAVSVAPTRGPRRCSRAPPGRTSMRRRIPTEWRQRAA